MRDLPRDGNVWYNEGMYIKILLASALTALLVFPVTVSAQYSPPGEPFLGGSEPCEDLPPIPSLGGSEVQVQPCGQSSSSSATSSGGGSGGSGGGGGGGGGGGRRPPAYLDPEGVIRSPGEEGPVLPYLPIDVPPVTLPPEIPPVSHSAAPLSDTGPATWGVVTLSICGSGLGSLALSRKHFRKNRI